MHVLLPPEREFSFVFALNLTLPPTICMLIWMPVAVNLSARFGLRDLRLCSTPNVH